MKANSINLNFKGYKNPIVSKRVLDNGNDLTYLALQLTDEGQPDLTKWRTVQKELGVSDVKDTIMLMSHKNPFFDGLFLNGDVMPGSKDLKKMMPYGGDTAWIKMYTLLAGITKRISNSSSFQRDGNYKNVFQFLIDSFNKVTDKRASIIIAQEGLENRNFQETAAHLNKKIDVVMRHYFR